MYPEQAKAFQEALKLNAVTLKEIIYWADTIIESSKEPNINFIELSLCKKTTDAISCLNDIAVSANEEQAYKILFGLLYTCLINGCCSYLTVSKKLYFWSAYETDLSGYEDLMYFWDAIDLAESGQHGDINEVHNELLDFLNEHKA